MKTITVALSAILLVAATGVGSHRLVSSIGESHE